MTPSERDELMEVLGSIDKGLFLMDWGLWAIVAILLTTAIRGC